MTDIQLFCVTAADFWQLFTLHRLFLIIYIFSDTLYDRTNDGFV